MGLLFSVTSLAHAQPAVAATQPTIAVDVGKPTYIHRLHYKKMYSEKPFEEAVLYYYDNGLYKIISPGENHYGVYVVEGILPMLNTASATSHCPHPIGAGMLPDTI